MNRHLLTAMLLFVMSVLNAQEFVSLKQAKTTAQKEGKAILMIFQGSDWCIPCMKFEEHILKSESFLKFANDKLVVLTVDFPRKKKNALTQAHQQHNSQLAEKYNREGYFPLAVLLNEQAEVLGKIGYDKSQPEVFVERLASLNKGA